MFVTLRTQSQSQVSPPATRLCTHSRLIDDVLTLQGRKSGKVRCLECGAVFDDPASVQEAGAIQNGTREQPWHD